jgi:hypothetical protein
MSRKPQASFLGQSLYRAMDARHSEPGHPPAALAATFIGRGSTICKLEDSTNFTGLLDDPEWPSAISLRSSWWGWYPLIPPVFSPMGRHLRSFNDLSAPLNRWDIWASFGSEISCRKGKQHLRTEAPIRLKFDREHPDLDSEWQYHSSGRGVAICGVRCEG